MNYQIHILEKTSEIAHSLDKLEKSISTIQYSRKTLLYNRLLNWIDFFNQLYSLSDTCFYQPMLNALSEIVLENELFKNQTGHEFELSKSFILNVFLCEKYNVITHKTTAKKVLLLSIIYSKYPGMVLKSPLKLFQASSSHLSPQEIDTIFKKIFVKYETPNYIIQNFEYLSLVEIEILMKGLQGKNLRNHSYFPTPLTKRDFTRLMMLDFIYTHSTDYIILRAAIIVKFNVPKNLEAKLEVFLKSSFKYMYEPVLYFQDIVFWKRAFEIITHTDFNLRFMGISDCVDFFEYKKYFVDAKYSLKGRTINSMSNAIHRWHNEIFNINHPYRNLKWKGIDEPNIQFYFENVPIECVQLTNGEELFEEGISLSHCVISYAKPCQDKICSIWSLRLVKGNISTPFITIEVQQKKVVQARLRHNLILKDQEIKIVKKWASKMNFELDLYKNF